MHKNVFSFCDKLATSFLKIATSSLWYVNMLTSWAMNSAVIFLGHAVLLELLAVLLYWVSMLVRHLLANSIGHSAAFLGASFLGNHILSLTCRRPPLRPTPGASVLGIAVLMHYRLQWFHPF